LALFLTIAGTTGIFLAWVDELDAAMAPGLHRAAPPRPGAVPLPAPELRRQVLARHPGARIDYLPLTIAPGRTAKLSVTWDEGTPLPDWDELFVDPYTGRELGHRRWGDISEGAVNLMPFVYRLHYTLALGAWGRLAFGLAALVWTLDCFVGLYLTLPGRQRRPRAPARIADWWRRWRPSWQVRWRGSSHKRTFDLHRAGGLWLWPMLAIFAWSGVSLNLPQVYVPVMRQLGAEDPREAFQNALLPASRPRPAIGFDAALASAERLASSEAARHGLRIERDGDRYLWYAPEIGCYVYGFTSSADFTRHGAGTTLVIDGDNGRKLRFGVPAGRNAADTFGNWIVALHMADVLGLPWRIAVSLIGALVTMLSVTGVIIWMRKRGARIASGR
jgi:uncharacterized iron-regulated membrane protein